MHNNIRNVYPVLGNVVDKAASAFIDDCQRRGLADKVLLVITGEMGRTPGLGIHAGRDHWGHIVPVALYGGGLKTGQVVGPPGRLSGRARLYASAPAGHHPAYAV